MKGGEDVKNGIRGFGFEDFLKLPVSMTPVPSTFEIQAPKIVDPQRPPPPQTMMLLLNSGETLDGGIVRTAWDIHAAIAALIQLRLQLLKAHTSVRA
jgi:hypothetical protein